jgi:hypothetical protein
MSLETASSWCVLRMSGPATLGVASCLTEAGFDAWTPAQVNVKRVGPRRKAVERPSPLLPTFVFARYDRLADLVAFSRSPAQTFRVWDSELRRLVAKGCPHFSVMRHDSRYIAIADRALDELRLAEQRGKPLARVRTFAPGETVKCPDAGFEGLVGIVQTTRGRHALVCFEGLAIPVTVPTTSLLAA